MALEMRRLYEVRIHGFANGEEALALQAPIARALCADEMHAGPCDVPWGFIVGDEEETVALILGIYATVGQAADVAGRVRAIAGETRPVSVNEDDTDQFEGLVEQHRIENEAGAGPQ
ncbi:hypothetical protein [Amycolatopsis taiwanensis]|uniref:hypothetical protein n=1 Tax=Amycolatopsis taiwanensis TaxID=342230 RepID=UPI0004821CA8|nr:hypothetical protein [Amycolatopsis taiwanensis]